MWKRNNHTYLEIYYQRLEIARFSGIEHACLGKGNHPKHRYKTFDKALQASYGYSSILSFQDPNYNEDKILVPYPCPFCHGFHIGNGLSDQGF